MTLPVTVVNLYTKSPRNRAVIKILQIDVDHAGSE